MNTPNIDKTYEINRIERDLTPKAALARLRLTLNTNAHLCDERGFILSTNEELDEAQSFIRDNLDNATGAPHDDYPYEHLTPELTTLILTDLKLIWGYEYYRDDLSQIAIELSLCPLHFCDWASCFDDDDDECAQIRSIFPHCHDT